MNITVRPQVPLGYFMLSRGGSTDPSRQPKESFVLYSIPAFDTGQPEFVRGSDIGSPKKDVRGGDVLLSRIVPHIRRSWIVGEHPGKKILASGEWIVFRSDEIHDSYLRHFLISDMFHQQFMQTVAGVGGSLLRANPNYVSKITIPLPPLDEQQRIAAILDKADALRRKRKSALDLLDSLTPSIFLEMFGDFAGSANKWGPIQPLGNFSDIVSGITKGRKLKGELVREVPYLAVSNVQDKFLDMTVVKTIEASENEIQRFRLKENDLLLTEGGDPDKLGRGTLWANELNESIHQNHIFRVRVTSNKVLPVYLIWLLGSLYGKAYFLRSAKQTTGIASINKKQLCDFPVAVPPIDLQRNFEKRVRTVKGILGLKRTVCAAADSLFCSLQCRAFSGQL